MPRTQHSSKSHMMVAKPHTPVAIHHSAPVAVAEKPGFGQLTKEGIGFGAGQAIAHRAVNAILGPTVTATATATPNQTCKAEKYAFESCLKTKTQEDQCNNEFLAFTECIKLN